VHHGPVNARGVVVGVLACLALAGCGEPAGSAAYDTGFTLPVGPVEWDVSVPSWYHDGTLHVGERSVELGDDVDQYVLGVTGAYWVRGEVLMFTSADGDTEEVEDVGWANLAVSADRSVLATVDQSRGPTDEYGAHVLQVVAFDTRTGEQLYRTPDEEPDDGADLTDLYGEIMPLLRGVSTERIFFDDTTIQLDDGSTTPARRHRAGQAVYEGYAGTLFADGFHVGTRGDGAIHRLAPSWVSDSGRLSPDRSTLFDPTVWPTPAVAYDATTGRPRPIDAPWEHFTLGGWSDEDTFFGVAEHVAADDDSVLRARQVVTCELRTLACSPVSPVIPTEISPDGDAPTLLMEGSLFRH
jgi:hypothetical protein